MNKFVIGALALTSASSLAYAGGEETKEWSTLDRDILSLTSNPPPVSQVALSAFVRSRAARSNDVDVDPSISGKQKLSGFAMDNARVALDISQGDYGAHISLDAIDVGGIVPQQNSVGDAKLLDAYATASFGNGISAQMGLFRPPFLWSALINENNMLLLDRTFNGQVWDERDQGVQVSGVFDNVNVFIAVQNGADNVQSGYRFTGRATISPLGKVGMQEGAFGASADTGLTLGAAYSDDNSSSIGNHGESWALDGCLTQGGFSLHAELVDYQDDVTPDAAMNLSTGALNAIGHNVTPPVGFHGSETPWSATAGFAVSPNIEIVGRYEDLDDSDNTTAITFGVNFYGSGHNAKLTLEVSRSNSDAALKEADTVALGVTVGA